MKFQLPLAFLLALTTLSGPVAAAKIQCYTCPDLSDLLKDPSAPPTSLADLQSLVKSLNRDGDDDKFEQDLKDCASTEKVVKNPDWLQSCEGDNPVCGKIYADIRVAKDKTEAVAIRGCVNDTMDFFMEPEDRCDDMGDVFVASDAVICTCKGDKCNGANNFNAATGLVITVAFALVRF